MDDSAILLTTVQTKYELLRPLMDERMRRQWAASEALALKRGSDGRRQSYGIVPDHHR